MYNWKPCLLCFISCSNSLCCSLISVVVLASCFNKMIMVNLLIYLTTTLYQFVFFPVILMILLYLASPFLTASSCFCLAYHYNSITNYNMFYSLLCYTIWNGIIIGIFLILITMLSQQQPACLLLSRILCLLPLNECDGENQLSIQ